MNVTVSPVSDSAVHPARCFRTCHSSAVTCPVTPQASTSSRTVVQKGLALPSGLSPRKML